MKNLTIALTVLSLGIASSLVQAEPAQKVSGIYLGGAFGDSKGSIDSDWTETSTYYNYTDIDSGSESHSQSDNAIKLLAGYQFNRIVAIEAAYINFGEFKGDEDIKSYNLSTNLGYTFNNGVRPFALIGVGKLDDTDEKHTTIHYGVGIEFAPVALNGVSFRATYEADIYSENETEVYNNTTTDSDNDFLFSAITIGAAYKF